MSPDGRWLAWLNRPRSWIELAVAAGVLVEGAQVIAQLIVPAAYLGLVTSLGATAVFGAFAAVVGGLYHGWRNSSSMDLSKAPPTMMDVRALHGSRAQLPRGHLVIESVSIKNFKGIDHVDIDMSGNSSLSGNWTCIAGINGAGKSSILQALCLLLLGERAVPELGRGRLRRMLREVNGRVLTAELSARCRIGDVSFSLYLPLSADGVDEEKLRGHDGYSFMSMVWANLQDQIIVSYGATRNISDRRQTGNPSFSASVQRQMTLFDPFSQIASIDALVDGYDPGSRRALRTAESLLKAVIAEAGLEPGRHDRLQFNRDGSAVGPFELPDGFRSSVAWLADICSIWHAVGMTEPRGTNHRDITGIVLLDEIDLHLHAKLQRELVPRLREELPNVQFIVTTHSPMILASFDRNELVILDHLEGDGIRHLDRQLFGLTMDEIYEWLMGTKPESKVISDKIENNDSDLALLIYQSKDTNEDEAKEQLRQHDEWLSNLKSAASDTR